MFQETLVGVRWRSELKAGSSRVRFPKLSLDIFIDMIIPAALRPWGRLGLKRNEYQEYFLGGKGGRYIGLTTLPPSCADCHEVWEPQRPGTLRACPDLYKYISLPLPLPCRCGTVLGGSHINVRYCRS